MLLDKLAGFMLLRKTMSASASLVESLLAGIAVIFILVLVISILLAALITGGIYVSYQILLTHNVDPMQAALIIGGAIAIILALIIVTILFTVGRIKKTPHRFLAVESAIAKSIDQITDSFMEGFEQKPLSH